MKKRTNLLLLVIASFIFSGCMSEPSAPNNYYTLSYVKDSKKEVHSSSDILKVDMPHAPLNLIGKRIVYAKNPYESAHYVKNRWDQPLPAMLQDWIIRSVENAKLYKAVVRSTSRVRTDLILESDIVSFEHRLDSKSVVISIRMNLIDSKTNKIIKSKLFSYEQSVAHADANSAVIAFNKALKLFDNDMSRWLEKK